MGNQAVSKINPITAKLLQLKAHAKLRDGAKHG